MFDRPFAAKFRLTSFWVNVPSSNARQVHRKKPELTWITLLLQITDLNLLVCDECHRAVKKDPYNCIMQEFYHDRSTEVGVPLLLGVLIVVFSVCTIICHPVVLSTYGVLCKPLLFACRCLAVVFSACGVWRRPVVCSVWGACGVVCNHVLFAVALTTGLHTMPQAP